VSTAPDSQSSDLEHNIYRQASKRHFHSRIPILSAGPSRRSRNVMISQIIS
jgi:hypothetical protein